MGMKRLCRFFAVLCGGVVLLSSCITEEVADNTASGNFDALWTTLDQHYCFFEEKKEAYGLDWQAVREEYRAAVAYMENCGITDGYTQERTSAKEEYTPDFDLRGL